MKSPLTIAIALVSVIPVASLLAQQDLVGKHVRITMPDTLKVSWRPSSAPPPTVIGQLAAISDSAMSIRNESTSSYVTIPLSRVQRLEVRSGLTRRETAGIGALVGVGVGAVFGFASGEDCTSKEFICFPREETAVFGAFAGAVIGGAIGYLVARGQSWRDASIPRVSVVPISARSMVLSSTLRF
jgi:hypothetical protein